MFKYSGSIIGKNKKAFINKIFGLLFFNVYAEEEDNDDIGSNAAVVDTSSNSVINYEELIAKARKEEKEKMYKKLQKLKEENNTLINQHNKDLLRIGELESKINLSSTQNVDELNTIIKSLTTERDDLSNKLLECDKNLKEKEDEIRNKVKEEYEIKLYLSTKLLENKDTILVPELVQGNTKEDIDASIEKAKERSEEIKKSLGMNRTYRTPKTSSNPSIEGIQSKQFDLSTLATMDVSSPEYRELRKQLGLK